MEPNNIEKQIREQLNARQINPSENSWDRLDAMLSVAENKKRKPVVFWWYSAAAIVLFFSIGAFFFNSNNSIDKTSSPIVNNEDHSNQEINNEKVPVVKSINKESQIQTQSNTPIAIQNQKSFNPINEKKLIKSAVAPNLRINQSEDLQKAVVQSEKKPSTIILSKEPIPTLTASINNSIVISTPKKVKVDPNMLLSEVDGELNQAYRESKLDLIKRNFKAIRVAVANRNDQQ